MTHFDSEHPALQGALHGPKVAAVAVVAQAAWGMAQSLRPMRHATCGRIGRSGRLAMARTLDAACAADTGRSTGR